MKKKLFIALLIGALSVCTTNVVFADEKDDRIAELEAQVTELQATIDELTAQLEAAGASKSTDQAEYKIGETWVVEGQWKLTIDSVEETQDRNEFSDKSPAAVYVVTYTYENLGYESEYMNGLFISLSDGIVDNGGKMGYSYPGNVTMYAQETPVGASCQAQECIGVDNPGSFKINFNSYDGNDQKQSAVFNLEF